ncbi:SDR family oxidoreductase [Shewanella maritima]|uniref:SDR family oxidoreductase n=1 Tax=Shewanella maritima TaxID=2520507 RepID=UPI003736A3B2
MSKYIVITGGASGLGQQLAKKWAQQGWHVCIIDKNQQLAQQVCQQIVDKGQQCMAIQCDITDADSVSRAFHAIMQQWPRVDALVNNAGVATADQFETESIEQWRWIFDINLFGLINVTQQFIPLFKQQGNGQIINIASQAALTPIPFMASYNASKSAVLSLSETLKIELADDNIPVSVVCPGFFKTNLGSSLRTQLPIMADLMHKMFSNSPLDAAQVADIIYQKSQAKQFLIQTHSQGKQLFLLKQLLPWTRYLTMLINKTKGLRYKVKQLQKDQS